MADVSSVKSLVREICTSRRSFDGEFQLECMDGDGWIVTTLADAIMGWLPPGPPDVLLASRWDLDDELRDGTVALTAALSATIARGVDAGIISPRQAASIKGFADEVIATPE